MAPQHSDRSRLIASLVVVCSALFPLISCASLTHTQSAPTPRSGIRPATDPVFNSPVSAIPYEDHVLESDARYSLRRVTFPSVAENGQIDNLVTVDYHQSRLPGCHPAVIVLPIRGRHVYPSNAITRTLRKRSNGRVHVLNVLGTDFLIDWPKLGALTDESEFVDTWIEGAEHEIATLIDIRRLIDWAESRPEIDADRIALIGFSHGAMLAPAVVAQESRIAATVLVMGGAHPQEIAARCNGERTRRSQLIALGAFGWDQDELEARLEPVFQHVDSANYPGRADPSRVLVFEAGKDRCVPESAREALWLIMGRPERYTIHADHHRAFYSMTPLGFNWLRRRVWDFFERKLVEEPGAR